MQGDASHYGTGQFAGIQKIGAAIFTVGMIRIRQNQLAGSVGCKPGAVYRQDLLTGSPAQGDQGREPAQFFPLSIHTLVPVRQIGKATHIPCVRDEIKRNPTVLEVRHGFRHLPQGNAAAPVLFDGLTGFADLLLCGGCTFARTLPGNFGRSGY